MTTISFSTRLLGLLLVLLLAAPTGCTAQAQTLDTLTVKGLIKDLISQNSTMFSNPDSVLDLIDHPLEAVRLVTDFLEEPETLNEILQEALVPRIRLLKDLNLHVKTFTVDTVSSLGLSYSYSKNSVSKTILNKATTTVALNAQVNANGDIAFRRVVNPKDFLETKASGQLYVSNGGITVLDSAAQAGRLARRRELLMQAAASPNPEDNEAAQMLTAEMLQQFSTHWYVNLAFTAGYESNQNFSSTQLVFGFDLGLDIKPWGNGNVNIFDYPFAAVRWLAGVQNWKPRASTFPTFLIGLHRIDPSNSEARELAGNTDIFNRFQAEIVFRTPLIEGSYLDANFRYFRQLNPPQAIIDANLDEQVFFTAALTAPNGMFVSYTAGRLPFDQSNDQIYELGFRYKF